MCLCFWQRLCVYVWRASWEVLPWSCLYSTLRSGRKLSKTFSAWCDFCKYNIELFLFYPWHVDFVWKYCLICLMSNQISLYPRLTHPILSSLPLQDECHRMNTAGGVCLSVLSSLLAVAGALAAVSALALAPLSALAEAAYGVANSVPSTGAEGTPSPLSSPCSSLVAGVLYGSFSLRELFPSRAPGCSWSLENPDPTKYSLYLRFTRHPVICRTHSPMLLSLDHHLANQSCPLHLQTATARDQEVIDLCGSRTSSDGPYSFLQFDKNFVQLCLTRHPAADEPQVSKELLELRLVEVLLINNENSSQFTCGVLCRWFEECLRTDHNGDQEVSDGDGCGMTQTGCICPNHNIMAPPVPLLPETPHTFSNGSLAPDDCCVTELHSNDAIAIAPRDVRQGRIPFTVIYEVVFQCWSCYFQCITHEHTSLCENYFGLVTQPAIKQDSPRCKLTQTLWVVYFMYPLGVTNGKEKFVIVPFCSTSRSGGGGERGVTLAAWQIIYYLNFVFCMLAFNLKKTKQFKGGPLNLPSKDL